MTIRIDVHLLADKISHALDSRTIDSELGIEGNKMKNAKSILESRREEIGRNAKIAAIHAWAKEFFAGVDDDVIDSTDDVSVGGVECGWCFSTDIQSSFMTVDCDTYSESEWKETEILRLLFTDIDAETIGQVLSDHFRAVISDAKFIKT